MIAPDQVAGQRLAGYIAVNAVTPAAKTAIFDQMNRSTSISCSRSAQPFRHVEEVAALVADRLERELLHRRCSTSPAAAPRGLSARGTGWPSRANLRRPSALAAAPLDHIGVLGAVEAVHVEGPLQADERAFDARQEEQRGNQRQWQPDCQVHPGWR